MSRTKFLRSVTIMIMLMVFMMPSASVAAARPGQGIRLTRIGNPTWKPVDFHIFAAPFGWKDQGNIEFPQTMAALLPGPDHYQVGWGIYPGQAHPPPYTSEFAQGIARNGYHEDVQFSRAEFSNGKGVWFTWMTVPDPGTTGSSPDFDSGPIIPNTVFPISITGIAYHNNKLFDPWLAPTYQVPPIYEFNWPDYPFDWSHKDGHSHFPDFIADNIEYGPAGAKIDGTYTYSIDELDANGNGWHIEVHFTVGDD